MVECVDPWEFGMFAVEVLRGNQMGDGLMVYERLVEVKSENVVEASGCVGEF
jgi:hypothetical protein